MDDSELPIELQNEIEALLGPIQPVASVKSDVNYQLEYGSLWLIATREQIFIFEEKEGEWNLTKQFALSGVEEVRNVGLVGIGALEGMTGGHPFNIMYYSNAVAEEVCRAGRALDSIVQNRPLVADDGEEKKLSRKCKHCGFHMGMSRVCPRCLKKTAVISRLLQIARPYWGAMAFIVTLLLLGTGMALIQPLLTKTLIDEAIPNSRYDLLIKIVLALFGLHFMATVLQIFRNRITSRVSSALTYDLRAQMFERLQAFSVSFYDNNQVGSLMARVTRDTAELQTFISQMTNGIMHNLFMILGVGVMLFYLNWKLALYVLIPWPFVVYGTIKFWRTVIPRVRRLIYSRWRMSAGLNAALSGVRVVKAFAQEDREIERFKKRNEFLFNSQVSYQYHWHTYYPLITFFFPVGGFIVWLVGGRQATVGTLTIGSLIAFLAYLGRFQAPLMALTQTSNHLTRFLTAAQRIFEILDQPPEITDDPDAISMNEVKGKVEFQNVSFGYLPNQLVLENVSFKLEPGEMLGIVGPSGAGKTTLINLICRFYDVVEGRVMVDDIDVRKAKKSDLRHHIGLVLQEPFLFRGTVAENITYGMPNATREEIVRAAKAANAHEFIVRLPEGYDTRLGERGSGISVGEKQRVSIARAILFNPQILILDEATSSVDLETERKVQQALDQLVQNRTTIAIAHRLSTLRNADRLMVIAQKKVQEMGTHDELMAKEGIYYRFMKMQDGSLEDDVPELIGRAV